MDFNNILEMMGIRKAKLEEDTRLSAEAQRILESPLVDKFFKDMETKGVEMWKESVAEDIDGRERLYAFMKLTGNFKKFFEKCIVDGKIAEKELADIASGKYENM